MADRIIRFYRMREAECRRAAHQRQFGSVPTAVAAVHVEQRAQAKLIPE